MCAIVAEGKVLLLQQGTEHGNPTFEGFDPSFLYSDFPSAKLDYNVCGMFTFML